MGPLARYLIGTVLWCVGLLNVVLVVGIPLWLKGRRMRREAKRSLEDRPPFRPPHGRA